MQPENFLGSKIRYLNPNKFSECRWYLVVPSKNEFRNPR
jgi:hypothetical protein